MSSRITVTAQALMLGLCLAFCNHETVHAADAPRSQAHAISFNRDIRPILSDNCFSCHGPSSAGRKANLRLDQREAVIEAGVVSSETPEDSELLHRVLSTDPDEVMPPPSSRKTLNNEQKELLKRWVEQGARYEPHWAFIPVPAEVPAPRPADPQGWVRTPIDAFVLERLREDHVPHAAEATRSAWLRRVTIDLTGLPPSLAEQEAFLADHSAESHERVVDRLLNSPARGERLANDWLDVARYADTFGYQADREMHMWPWRDWVIRAFNSNLPYNDFILWQIAGDMLPQPSREQTLATAFNRLHRQTNEGGSIEEEFRVEYVADRVRTMGSAFLGLTLECSRCHDHKYDPITQKEYYQLTAFFNNIDEHGLYSHFTETAPTPALLLYEGDQERRHRDVLARIGEQESTLARVLGEARTRFQALGEFPPVEAPKPAASYSFEDLKAKGPGENTTTPGKVGQAILFDGDEQYVCKDAPPFGRTTPFSLGLWVKPKEHQPRMMVAHRSRAAEDSAFRGFSLVFDKGIPVVSLIHFWPGNAIQIRARTPVPLNEWSHLLVTYDGRGRARGLKLYLNGVETPCETIRDRLNRDITHRAEWGDSDANVPLALGARFRDVGFKDGAVDEVRVFDRELTPLEAAATGGIPIPTDDESRFRHFASRIDAEAMKAATTLLGLCNEENTLIGQVRQIMVMQEMPRRRPTFLLARGAYDARSTPVEPNTPERILPLPAGVPRDRLGFARWLIDERNPLTARVAVNRVWQMFFGRGLVATTEDFGSQGQPPTHSELLDWLARRFMDSGWDVRALSRMIVLSATYRQSSVPENPALYQSDPDNVLLARGPRHRLTSEQIRDGALAASGLLTRRIGGPSVYPYQPAGLWEESGTGKSYQQSHGDGLYRRSLYTFWRRTSPPPSMTVFDAPSREFCLTRRERTTTPLQALAVLNDPQYIEAARVLAERLIHEQADEIPQRLTSAFRLLSSREPNPRELDVLARLYKSQRAHYQQRPAEAKLYIATGESARDDKLDPIDHAATTAVVQALMNFDECLMKR